MGWGEREILRNLADSTERPGKSEDWGFLELVDIVVSSQKSTGWTSRLGMQAGFLGPSLEAKSFLQES